MGKPSFTSVVTGANSGIGLETARALARRGDRLFFICRSRDRGERAAADVALENGVRPTVIVADLSVAEQVQSAAEQIASMTEQVDVLVNNAGGYFPERMLSLDGTEMNLALNHLAYFRLSHYLLPLLRVGRGSRVVNLASRAHRMAKLDFSDLEFSRRKYRPFVAYGTSKLMNILFTRAFAQRFPEGPMVNAVHPGVVRTGFGHDYPGLFSWLAKLAGPFMTSSEQGASTSIYLATSADVVGMTGQYFANSRQITPKPFALDETSASTLWDLSEEMCGFTFGQY